MPRIFRIVVWLLASLLPAIEARAQQQATDQYPGIIGKDDRQIIDSWDPPWGAIGQVNISGATYLSFCTGTLIAPRVVLTAAHCLYDPRTSKPFPVDIIHFVAGVRRDKSLGHSVARCVRFAPDYRFPRNIQILPDVHRTLIPFEGFISDIATIVLRQDIEVEPVPVATGIAFEEGLPLIHPSYPSDRRFILTADKGCRLISIRDGVWSTSCDSQGGSSGGPILVERDGRLQVAGVIAGNMQRIATLAVPVTAWKDLPLDADCP